MCFSQNQNGGVELDDTDGWVVHVRDPGVHGFPGHAADPTSEWRSRYIATKNLSSPSHRSSTRRLILRTRFINKHATPTGKRHLRHPHLCI